jgi:uncharacterized Zn-finger protein
MAPRTTPQFQNDAGLSHITIGVKEFECIGARPPHDHPHIYIDMGDETEAVCSYCSTVYRFDPRLSATQSDPPEARFTSQGA